MSAGMNVPRHAYVYKDNIYIDVWCCMENETRTKILSLATGLLVAFSMIFTAERIGAVYTMGEAALSQKESFVVVVDAGHGGFDPGKVGINGAQEKDINLAIAKKVASYLEAGDVEVIMTRENDEGLYDADSHNKKVQDMKQRIQIMEESQPDLAVSIHQNSYPEEYVRGAQVFYHKDSGEGQRLAAFIQQQFVKSVDPENKRQIKANDSYYLLKKTGVPIVIVECGFLSNYGEAEKLAKEEYQDKVAWAIYMGIMNYLNSNGA